MKTEEQLLRKLTDMIKDTRAGSLRWEVECQTTEYNDASTKHREELDGEEWTVDECFVSYDCMWRDEEFLMITYEKIYTLGDKKQSRNLVFLPPLGIRLFRVDVLSPFLVKTNKMLTYEVHMLWLTILERYRSDPQSIELIVHAR